MDNIKKERSLFLEILLAIFQALFFSYIIFYLLEILMSGFVSNFYNLSLHLNIMLFVGIFVFFVISIERNEISEENRKGSKFFWFLSLFFSVFIFGIIYFKLKNFGFISLLLAFLSSLLLFFVFYSEFNFLDN